MMPRIYLALGSNVGNRAEHLKDAISTLEAHRVHITGASSVYETGAMYVTDQDDFLNQVVEVETDFKPEELLRICKQLEDELGREKTIRFGPRSIDIDILIYGDVSLKTETLELPHPRMCERDFVLVPLREIAPDILLAGNTIEYWMQHISEKSIKRKI